MLKHLGLPRFTWQTSTSLCSAQDDTKQRLNAGITAKNKPPVSKFLKERGYGGKGYSEADVRLFSREKKFFPFPHKSFLYQIINRKGGAEAAEDGWDEADGADFAVSETL